MRSHVFFATGVALSLVYGALAQAQTDSPQHEISQKEITQGRDLKQYDDGGEFPATLRDEGTPRIDVLRSFIWNHWKRHRRGYIRASITGIDHHVASHIFIEPDHRGAWHVGWRTVYMQAFIPPPPPRLEDLPDIVSVEQAKPKNVEQQGAGYVLVFRAKDGKEVWRL